MSSDGQSPRQPGRSGIGSWRTIVLVFAFATVVVLAILLAAFFVAIGMIALAIPAAVVASDEATAGTGKLKPSISGRTVSTNDAI